MYVCVLLQYLPSIIFPGKKKKTKNKKQHQLLYKGLETFLVYGQTFITGKD